MAQRHSLVIRGGTVVDGSGGEPFEADVAIDDGRIIAVGPTSARAPRRSTRAASSSRRASSTCTRTTTRR